MSTILSFDEVSSMLVAACNRYLILNEGITLQRVKVFKLAT